MTPTMPIAFQLDANSNLITFNVFATTSIHEALNVIDQSIQQSKGDALDMDILLLVDEFADLYQFDVSVFEKLKDKCIKWLRTYPRSRTVKCAIVAQRIGQIALAHLWAAVSEAPPPIKSQTKVFGDEASARAWLAA